MKPKWSREKERVYRAAMRWAKGFRCYSFPREWDRPFEAKLERACAAAERAQRKGKRK